MTTDVVAALVTHLQADTDVAALVGTRVFGLELPRAEADGQPQKVIVIEATGGTPPPYTAATLQIQAERVDLRCFGENPYEAQRVRRAAYTAMKTIRRVVVGTVLLHWAQPAGGPLTLRDTDTDWPVVFQAWQVVADERATA